jgi:hypothetical protein
VFSISQRAKISATIWHLKTAYNENFGKMPEVLRLIEAARARGIDVAASVYPYTRYTRKQRFDFVFSSMGFGRWGGTDGRSAKGSRSTRAHQKRDG